MSTHLWSEKNFLGVEMVKRLRKSPFDLLLHFFQGEYCGFVVFLVLAIYKANPLR